MHILFFFILQQMAAVGTGNILYDHAILGFRQGYFTFIHSSDFLCLLLRSITMNCYPSCYFCLIKLLDRLIFKLLLPPNLIALIYKLNVKCS